MSDEKCPRCKVLTEKIERFKKMGGQRERADLELQMRLYAFAVLLGMEPDRDTTYIEVVDRAEAEISRLRLKYEPVEENCVACLTGEGYGGENHIERVVGRPQTPPATSGEPATGMAIFDEYGNPDREGGQPWRKLVAVCRTCGYRCQVCFGGETKASLLECPICHKDGPETQTPP